MLPFSKRPSPRPQDQWLESGDFEVVHAAPPAQVGHSADPYGAPNLPTAVFPRHASVAPYARTEPQLAPHHFYGDYVVPPAPHSLAPVAMASSSFATASDTHRGHAITMAPARHPSVSLGVMIALTGALLGGVLGLGLDAKRQEARAAAASAAYESAPSVAAAPPPAIAIVANPGSAARGANPSAALVAAVDPSAARIAPSVPAPSVPAPSVIAPSVIAPSVGNAKAADAPVAKGDKRSLASKAQAPSRQPSFTATKAARHQAADAAEPIGNAPPPAKAVPPVKADKSDNGDAQTKAAQQVLDQASKDTANTL